MSPSNGLPAGRNVYSSNPRHGWNPFDGLRVDSFDGLRVDSFDGLRVDCALHPDGARLGSSEARFGSKGCVWNGAFF
jgi:hypothetical protein